MPHPGLRCRLARQFGLAPTSDPAAVKLNAVLSRCLRVLRERIDVLLDPDNALRGGAVLVRCATTATAA